MSDIFQRLQGLSVSDVMTKNVVWLTEDQTLAHAASIFAKHSISSAPVVDSVGRCVGVLSAVDFMKAESSGNGAKDILLTRHVSEQMTTAVQSVTPGLPLLKVAVIMNSEHLHRIPVIDSGNHLVGVVSTMDIVSAMINAVEEFHGPILPSPGNTVGIE